MKAKDGRVTIKGKKVAYGYQVVAVEKFGLVAVSQLPASKIQDSPVLSHLCGTRNCLCADHLIIETKQINDERTHCHFCFDNFMKKNGHRPSDDMIKMFCPHNPLCCSLDERK
jgi:hypothetical protein